MRHGCRHQGGSIARAVVASTSHTIHNQHANTTPTPHTVCTHRVGSHVSVGSVRGHDHIHQASHGRVSIILVLTIALRQVPRNVVPVLAPTCPTTRAAMVSGSATTCVCVCVAGTALTSEAQQCQRHRHPRAVVARPGRHSRRRSRGSGLSRHRMWLACTCAECTRGVSTGTSRSQPCTLTRNAHSHPHSTHPHTHTLTLTLTHSSVVVTYMSFCAPRSAGSVSRYMYTCQTETT